MNRKLDSLRKLFGFNNQNETCRAASRKTGKTATHRDSMLLENLEPRVLFSGAPVEGPQDQDLDAPTADVAQAAPVASPAAGTATSPQSNPVQDAALQSLWNEGIQRWAASGLSAEQLQVLQTATFEVYDLGGNLLASTTGAHVVLDDDGAGRGWFRDTTPDQDEEFAAAANGALTALTGSEAEGDIDLLTVILHEQGHLLGLDEAVSGTGDVMSGILNPGQRHLVADGQALGAIPVSLHGSHAALTTAAIAGNVLTITGDGANDALTLRISGGNYEYELNGGGFTVIGATGGVNTINIDMGTGTDAVTLDSSLLGYAGSLSVNGAETVNLAASFSGTVTGSATTVNVAAGAKIQQGINLAASGATVNVAAGTYTESVVIGKALTLQGAGRDDTILRKDYSGQSSYSHVVDLSAASDVSIKDMTIGGINNLTVDGSGVVTDMRGYLIGHGNGYASTDNLTIHNVHFDGGRSAIMSGGDNLIVRDSLFTGHWLRGAIRPIGGSFLIQNNDFQGLHYQYGALTIEGSAQFEGIFDGNNVQCNANPGYFKTNGNVFQLEVYNNNLGPGGLSITNNTFDGATLDPGALNQAGNPLLNRAIYFEFDYVGKPVSDSSLINISGNDFSGFHNGGFFTPVGSVVTSNSFANIEGGVLRFDASLSTDAATEAAIASSITNNTINQPYAYATGPGTPSFPGLWSTIGRAVSDASAGDTVIVSDGTFVENVLIDKNITLLSQNGRAATTIQGISGVGALGTIKVNPGSTGVTIDGFTIIGIDNGDPGLENAAVYFQGAHSGAQILNNEIAANGDHGLLTEYGAAVTGFVIDGNIFSGQTFVGANPGGIGFGSQFTTPNVPRQLVVFGNGGGDAGSASATNITFTNNQITGVTGGISSVDGTTEQGNTLVTLDVSNSTISGNTFAGTSTGYATALRVRRPDTTILGNHFDSSNMGDFTSHIFLQNSTTPIETVALANTFDDGVFYINGANYISQNAAPGASAIVVPDADGDLTVRLNGANVEIYDGDGNLLDSALAANLNTLTLEGDGNDNVFTIDLTGDWLPSGGIVVNGNGQTGAGDSLVLTNGTVTLATYSFTSEHDGSIDLDGKVITYTGLEPLTSTITATDVVLNFTSANDEIITVTDNGDGTVTANSTEGETTTFNKPGNSLTINATNGSDSVTFTNNLTLGGTLAVNAATVNLNGDIAASSISGTASIVNVAAGASIQDGLDVAAAGATVNVAAGNYTEAVKVNQSVNLRGANADVAWGSRGAESIVDINTGHNPFSVYASDVSINGFKIVSPMANNGIWTDAGTTARNNISYTFNYLENIGTARGSGHIKGIHYQMTSHAAAHVTVSDNHFLNIGNSTSLARGASAIYFGQSTTTGTLDDLKIERNFIQNVQVTVSGYSAIGIEIGHGWNSTGSITNLLLRDNDISGISGGVSGNAVGIDLSGKTPGAIVTRNDVSNVTAAGGVSTSLAVGVNNTGAGTLAITGNSLNGGAYRIGNANATAVNASGNYWGSTDDATIAGQMVGSVDFNAYLGGGNAAGVGFVGDLSTVYVTDLGSQTGATGRVQEGVNLVDAGGTVNVAAGTYNERLSIAKSLNLVGAQSAVDPTGIGARTNPAAESIIDSTGLPVPNPDVLVEIANGTNDVSISGFTLIGSSTSTTADTSVVRAGGSSGTVNRLSVENNIVDGYYGVLLRNGTDQVVNANRFTVNKNGVVVQFSATDLEIRGNLFAVGTALASDPGAIYLTGVNGGVVDGNTASGFTGGRGLAGSNLTNLDVTNNTFTGNRDGVSIWGGSTFIDLENNQFSGNSRYGINIKGADLLIAENNLTGNGNAGVSLDRHVIDTERVTLFNNDLSGNTISALEVLNITATVNASSNWWGTATATAVQAKITGASSAFVDFTGFLANDDDMDLGTPGFQGDFSTIHVTGLGAQTGATGRIEEGAAAATSTVVLDGSTLSIEGAGTGSTATPSLTIASGTTYNVDIAGTGAGEFDQAVVTGAVTIQSSVTLSFSGTPILSGGESFVIIDNNGTADAVTGTFAGLAEGAVVDTNFLGSTLTARITYVGGDGNDVAIVVDGPAVIDGTGADDEFLVQLDSTGSNVLVFNHGVLVLSRPLDGVASLTINGSDGDDSFTVDFDHGDLAFPITFNGGGNVTPTPGDQLFIQGGGAFASATYYFETENSGSVEIAGQGLITYTGLEPVTSSITAADVTLDYTSASLETISVKDNGDGTLTVDSTQGESTTFNKPTNSLEIKSIAGGADIITFSNAVDLGAADLTVTTLSTGNFNLTQNVTTTGDVKIETGTLNLDAPGGAGTAVLSAANATFTPVSGLTVGIGGGAGTFNLTEGELTTNLNISAGGTVTIGSIAASTVTIGNLDTATTAEGYDLVIISGNQISQTGNLTTDGDITIQANQDNGGTQDFAMSGGSITTSGAVDIAVGTTSGTSTLRSIQGAAVTVNAAGAGTVSLAAGTLKSTTGNVEITGGGAVTLTGTNGSPVIDAAGDATIQAVGAVSIVRNVKAGGAVSVTSTTSSIATTALTGDIEATGTTVTLDAATTVTVYADVKSGSGVSIEGDSTVTVGNGAALEIDGGTGTIEITANADGNAVNDQLTLSLVATFKTSGQDVILNSGNGTSTASDALIRGTFNTGGGNVLVTADDNVTFNGGLTTGTVLNLGGGSLTASARDTITINGLVDVTSAAAALVFNADDDSGGGAGAFTMGVNGSITGSTGIADLVAINVIDSSGATTLRSITAKAITVDATGASAISLASGTLTATTGNVTINGETSVTLTGSGSDPVIDAAGDATIQATGAVSIVRAIEADGEVSVTSGSSIATTATTGDIEAGTTVTLDAATTVTVYADVKSGSGVSIKGDSTVTVGNGVAALEIDGGTGAIAITANADGDAVADQLTLALNATFTTSGEDITLKSGSDLGLGTLSDATIRGIFETNGGDVIVFAQDDLTFNGTAVSGTVLNLGGGSLTASARDTITINGLVDVTSAAAALVFNADDDSGDGAGAFTMGVNGSITGSTGIADLVAINVIDSSGATTLRSIKAGAITVDATGTSAISLASGTLTATSGDVSITGPSIATTGSIDASTAGSVILNATTTTLTVGGTVTAQNNVDLDSVTAMAINQTVTTTDGSVDAFAGSTLTSGVNGDISTTPDTNALGTVTLVGTTGVTLSGTVDSNGVTVTGSTGAVAVNDWIDAGTGAVLVTAGTSITTGASAALDAGTTVTLDAATAASGTYVTVGGDVTSGSGVEIKGNTSVTVGSGVEIDGGTTGTIAITANADGNAVADQLSLDVSATLKTSGQDITLKSGTELGAGTASDATIRGTFNTAGGDVIVFAQDDLTFNGTATDGTVLNLGTGSLVATAKDTITINREVKANSAAELEFNVDADTLAPPDAAAAGAFTMAATGSITGSAGLVDINVLDSSGATTLYSITAGAITVDATGTGAISLAASGTLTANTGSVAIHGDTSVTLTGDDTNGAIKAKTSVDITAGTSIATSAVTATANGAIDAGTTVTLEAVASSATLNGNVTGGGDVTVTAGDDVTGSGNITSNTGNISITNGTGDDVILGGSIEATLGTVTISADDALTLNGTVTADGKIDLNAGGIYDSNAAITSDSADVDIDATGAVANVDGTIWAKTDVTIDSGSSVTINYDVTADTGSVTVNANGSATVNASAKVEAKGGNVAIYANADNGLLDADILTIAENTTIKASGSVLLNSGDGSSNSASDAVIGGTLESGAGIVTVLVNDDLSFNDTTVKVGGAGTATFTANNDVTFNAQKTLDMNTGGVLAINANNDGEGANIFTMLASGAPLVHSAITGSASSVQLNIGASSGASVLRNISTADDGVVTVSHAGTGSVQLAAGTTISVFTTPAPSGTGSVSIASTGGALDIDGAIKAGSGGIDLDGVAAVALDEASSLTTSKGGDDAITVNTSGATSTLTLGGDLSTGAAGSIEIVSGNDVTVNATTVTTGTGQLLVQAQNDVAFGASDELNIVSAALVDIDVNLDAGGAETFVMGANAAITGSATAVDISVSNSLGTAQVRSITVADDGSILIDTNGAGILDVVAGTLTAGGTGTVTLDSEGGIDLDGNIVAGGAVTLTAKGSVGSIDGTIEGEGVTITADGAVTVNNDIDAGGGLLTIQANADGTGAEALTIDEAATLETTNTSNTFAAPAIKLTAGSLDGSGNPGTTGSDLVLGGSFITGPGGWLVASADDGVTVNTTTVNVTSTGRAYLISGDSMDMATGETLSVTAASELVLNVNLDGAGADDLDMAGTAAIDGNAGIIRLNLASATGAHTLGNISTTNGYLFVDANGDGSTTVAGTLSAGGTGSVVRVGINTEGSLAVNGTVIAGSSLIDIDANSDDNGAGAFTMGGSGLLQTGSTSGTSVTVTVGTTTGASTVNNITTNGGVVIDANGAGGITLNATGSIALSGNDNVNIDGEAAVTINGSISANTGVITIVADSDASDDNQALTIGTSASLTTNNATTSAISLTAGQAGGTLADVILGGSFTTNNGGRVAVTAADNLTVYESDVDVGTDGDVILNVKGTVTFGTGQVLTVAAAAELEINVNTAPGADVLTMGTGSAIAAGATGAALIDINIGSTTGTSGLYNITTASGGVLDVDMNGTGILNVLSGGLLSTPGTGTVLLDAEGTIDMDGTVNAGDGTITIHANSDGDGTQGYTGSAGGALITGNSSATAIFVEVNTAGGGTGTATIGDMTVGAGGTITVLNHGASITTIAGETLSASGGTITLRATDLAINTSLTPSTIDAGSGTVNLFRSTDGNININGTTGFAVSDAEIDRIAAGTLVFGDANPATSHTDFIEVRGAVDTTTGLNTISGDVVLNAKGGLDGVGVRFDNAGTTDTFFANGLVVDADLDDNGSGTFVTEAGFGIDSSGGDIRVDASDFLLDAASATTAGAGDISLLPTASGRTVELGGSGAGKDVTLTDAELDTLSSSGTLYIGNQNTGDVTITAEVSPAGAGHTVITSGGSVIDTYGLNDYIGSGIVIDGNLEPGGSDPGTGVFGIFEVTGSFTFAADNDYRLEIKLNGNANPVAGTDYDQVKVNQAAVGDLVTIGANVILDLQHVGGTTKAPAGTQYVILDNGTSLGITGLFVDAQTNAILNEGDWIDQGLVLYTISYVGGDGNDVVLTSLGPVETAITLDGTTLKIDDVENTDTNDSLTLTRVGNNLRIHDPNVVVGFDGIPSAVRIDPYTVDIPYSAFTGIEVNTAAGNDSVTVGDLGTLPGGLVINGGADTDTILQSGDVTLGAGAAASYSAETITLDTNADLVASGAGSVTLDAGRTLLLEVFSTVVTDSGDVILTANVGGAGTGNFAGVTFKGATVASTSGDVSLEGRGGTTGNYNRGIFLGIDSVTGTASQISTGGSVELTGTGGAGGQQGSGVVIDRGTVQAGTGVTIDGTGGAGTQYNEGVSIFLGLVDAGTGALSITGTGASTGSYNRGIAIGSSTLVSAGGDISLEGFGGGSALIGAYSLGTELVGTIVGTTGAGTVTLDGTGASGTQGNVGLKLHSSTVAAADGLILLTGTGQGSTTANTGLQILASTQVLSSGTGGITVTGFGSSSGTSTNYGVEIASGSVLSVADGDLTVEGTGGGTLQTGKGVVLGNAILQSTGTADISLTGWGSTATLTGTSPGIEGVAATIRALGSGNVTLTGTGGTGTNLNRGVVLASASAVTTASGNLSIEGTGGGSGTASGGVLVNASTILSAGGSGNLTILGTSAVGTNSNEGVQIASYSMVTTVDGDLVIDGTGRGTGQLINGVLLSNATLSATGSGDVSVTGTSTTNAATGSFNRGINMSGGSVNTVGGSITLIGDGGRGVNYNEGMRLVNAVLSSTGGGAISLTGTALASTTGTANTGAYLSGVTLDSAGAITVTGTGGGGTATSANHGVYMQSITVLGSMPSVTGTAGAGTGSKATTGNFFP